MAWIAISVLIAAFLITCVIAIVNSVRDGEKEYYSNEDDTNNFIEN